MILSSVSEGGKSNDGQKEKQSKKQPSFLSTPTTVSYTPTTGHLSFPTAPTGDGDDEKRSSKQGEVKGQGLGRGKARMQGFPPGVLFGEEVEVGGGEGFSVIGAVRKPESCIPTQKERPLFLLLYILDYFHHSLK